MSIVKGSLAYAWTCPNCGCRNYDEPVIAEMTAEVREDAIDQGVDPEDLQTGEWVTMPEDVSCIGCQAEFELAANDEGDRGCDKRL